MQDRDRDNTPLGGGTGIAVAVGAVAFLACWLILGFKLLASLLIGAVLFAIVALILRQSKPSAERASPPVARPAPPPSAPAPAAPAAPAPAASPEPAAPPPAPPPPAAEPPAAQPPVLEAARGGAPDDLKKIKGVGPKLEALLNRMGFYHYDQIANWTPEQIAWVDENLEGFKGRVSRDDWVGQAKTLAAGGETEFSKRQG